MRILVLGKGIANDGVIDLLNKDNFDYDYLNLDEIVHYDYDLVVKAPSISYENEVIKNFIKLGIRVIQDIELATLLRKKTYIGVTGSNGKTTTVSLIKTILERRYKVVLCGNIGYSVCKALVENEDVEIFIVELSSFQLEYAQLDLDISVILNINPCHLDHHNTFKNYVNSKKNIFINQSHNHHFIYNYNDIVLKNIANQAIAKKISFSNSSYLSNTFIQKNIIYNNQRKILKFNKELKNKEYFLMDVLATISVVTLFSKIKNKDIRKSIYNFSQIEYRLEKINNYIYNDAKSTNPYSTIAALKCFDKVNLICGGSDRLENLDCLDFYLHKINKVYAYGATKHKIEEYMIKHHVRCKIYEKLDEAVENAYKERKDEIILFSPMFASFDQFENYKIRGKYFEKLVNGLLKR